MAPRTTIYVPEELKNRMDKIPNEEVNWSQVACQAFDKEVKAMERKMEIQKRIQDALAEYEGKSLMDAEPFSAKELLLDEIGQAQEWRTSKAEEYPDDERNMKSAVSLARLQGYLSTLPKDSDVFIIYEKKFMDPEVENLDEREEYNYHLTRIGFYEEIPPEEAIEELKSHF